VCVRACVRAYIHTYTQAGLAALDALSKWTSNSWSGYAAADTNKVLFAGHSMGGHGAWVIATHYPDLAVGVASAAGWIRKEYYGDSNDLFVHDLRYVVYVYLCSCVSICMISGMCIFVFVCLYMHD
jgi:hypothetical protein